MIIRDEETIIAQCTPKGSGALALLRLSGTHALDIATRMSTLANNKTIATVATHTIHYGAVIHSDNTVVDRVMFLVMHGPKTFTGQNTVEITCHNNQFIVQAIITRALECGARLAQEGEFSQRAVHNKKIDVIQAEAINELIHAQTQQALKASLAQLDGSLSSWIGDIEQQLFRALAFCESSFEFIDEEITFDVQIKKLLNNVVHKIQRIKSTFDQQQQIRDGIRIALVGSVNAGKSSLLNALLGKDRAIVTDIAGTTRDTVEAGVYKNGTHWTLIDTAGLRETDDVIEQKGIEKSFEQARSADIVLLVFDSSRIMTPQEQKVYLQLLDEYAQKTIVIANKADLPQKAKLANECINISTQINTNINIVKQHIENKVKKLFANLNTPFLLNKRQFNLILKLENGLHTIMSTFDMPIAYELLSAHLKDCLEHLSEFSGRTISEKGMDTIFREFCVGK